MSVQLQPQIRIDIEWVLAPDIESDWRQAEGCVAPAPIDAPPIAIEEDEWWPGRCIP